MNCLLLKKTVQEFIAEKSNSTIDLSTLILKGSPFDGISVQELAQQIHGRRKAKQKLPSWYSKNGVCYPPILNLEQTSSEVTALYKSNLVSGAKLVDLTGGFGIDDYFFSKRIKEILHCELNKELSELANHNFKLLGSTNIKTIVGDGLEILKEQTIVDWIYVDPSRRHDSKGKVFFLEDCLPNIPQNLDFLFTKSNNILLKTSPLLDIQIGVRSLQHVKEIHIVAIENEVKELLWVLDKSYTAHITITTVNIQKKKIQRFSFLQNEEAEQTIDIGMPMKYLYEPNASILKSGGFLSIASTFKLKKLHINSHLYTSDHEIDFPGRKFKIVAIYPYQKKKLMKMGITKANITTRNFSESVAMIRKKLKIKDGGDQYLFFTTDCNNKKQVLFCEKVVD
ncbi:THUMP-like domain-containing protein [Aquimarina longa]|uniref:THUMP-like domain-containing protein n=1 Tax=Aquimarina longa TaxID=1080221 RepID=UPI0007845E03|nr:hypothetical protein [Aquimarina longa]